MRVPNLLMLVGACMWLAGELYGVVLDAYHKAHSPDTTSGWVWFLEHRWPFMRLIVAALLAILALHLLTVPKT